MWLWSQGELCNFLARLCMDQLSGVVSALLPFLSSDNQRGHYKLLQSGDAEELVW